MKYRFYSNSLLATDEVMKFGFGSIFHAFWLLLRFNAFVKGGLAHRSKSEA
jgi:hypothetical protein